MDCIPRDNMPQVNNDDLSALLQYLEAEHSIVGIECFIPTGRLQMRQCPDHFNPVHGTELAVKPLLVACDYTILDGNHRWCGARDEGSVFCHCIALSADFEKAVQAILHFGKTYRYGDGQEHKQGVW